MEPGATAVYDVLIVGAGLSGIGMACQLATHHPDLRVAIIERRAAMGGTWDLFRYPGVRSDSDMFTFGYGFRPWHAFEVMADGASIRRYVMETASEYGVDRHIQYGLKVVSSTWSGVARQWTVQTLEEATGAIRTFGCRFLVVSTGYYNYDRGYLPAFPQAARFRGLCVHPQQWPEGLDYHGKRVLIIGSGATAVTLVPAMADGAAHVTMLQRSPSYFLSLPSFDKISAVLEHVLPKSLVFRLARRRNIFLTRLIYKAARRWPDKVRALLQAGVRRQLGPDADMRHFTPDYAPWDQRLCVVPDGDLFNAIKSGKASVVTDGIAEFTERGVRLESGDELEADIIVTATGLEMQTLGGMALEVDGQPRVMGELVTYKGVLLQDTPNFACIFGYTNAPWTLKADLAASYVCRLLAMMRKRHIEVVTPRAPANERQQESIMASLTSGYVQRGAPSLPRQGRMPPWRVLNNYERDCDLLLRQPVEDAALECVDEAPAGEGASPDLVTR
ncbi:NAD(P)/FAD-dependent oxidoreductase [Dyella solisilvae]|uniref:NAD(P)/FAD-dependent oxidoreductase n=1 Tax=Dyella solisilvae TaxID=1920168 RepID=A0A370K7L0_9GAMM|nr:NAD(P)/FAD-dependent oxidoreductase [Dyella solisilvae]RDI98638.1 NAD(P)/FAD-dependent oxidoreductase [Dyella solisilvae]